MKTNLVIGNTSQLSHYFPQDYVKISSRNVDKKFLQNQDWGSVYITFAEQRIYEPNIDYITPNYLYTLSIIESLLDKADKIVCYTSCELWSELTGPVRAISTPRFSLTNEYTISKLLLLNKVIERRKIDERYNKVVFIHPFYFNSVRRSKYFLFGKIFNAIKNKRKIEVGSLDFYRDMVHTKFVVNKSIESTVDTMVGSGRLTHVRTFIKDLYFMNFLDFDEMVIENQAISPARNKMITAKVPWDYSYEQLLYETQGDLSTWIQLET